MKKILMFSLAGVLLSAPVAWAEHDGTSHKGQWFEKMDADKDGFLTKEEFMAKHEQRFIESDTDKDGKVSKAEADAQKEKWRATMKAEREKREAEQGKTELEKDAETKATETPPQ